MVNNFYWSFRNQCIKVYLNTLYPVLLSRRAKVIGKRDKIDVVFFAINLAMWRYQGVYDLLSKEKRFCCHIILTVSKLRKSQAGKDLQELRDFFNARSIDFCDYDDLNNRAYDVKNKINPDILFYPQPYPGSYPVEHDFPMFEDKLMGYIHYSINVVKATDWLYDLRFHNLAWKIYCPTLFEKDTAKNESRNKGRNWVVSGYCNLDRYIGKEVHDVWKKKDITLKRLIWAPHFSIVPESSWLGCRSNFLKMAQFMLNVADTYKHKLQIAFKPHPWLKSVLYEHPDWGKDRTDKYYERWALGENTQLETGDFVALFKTSDAMIHDCGSFTAEYLFVNKPVAFITSDVERLKEDHSDFGRAALDQHYIVGNESEIQEFIEDVVLGGSDPLAPKRTEFYETILRPNVTGTTSQFIVDDIKKSLSLV